MRSTVVDNKYILTEWRPPLIAPDQVINYAVYRSDDDVNYSEVGRVAATELSYSDRNVDVNNNQYFYKILVINFVLIFRVGVSRKGN